MVQRPDRPYWASWLAWHLLHRFNPHKAVQRRAVWAFINDVRHLPPNAVVIDGGANVGNVTSLFVARGAEVHAFEPDPHAADIFAGRFKDYPLVHLHRAALGSRNGRMRLYRTHGFVSDPQKATVSSTLFPRAAHSGENAVDVDVVDLADFIRSLGRRVDVLKLDIEGAEIAAVEKLLDEKLMDRIGVIYAETHERHSQELAEGTARLRRRIAQDGLANINLDWR